MSEQPKHTPGPWVPQCNMLGGLILNHKVYSQEGYPVAALAGLGWSEETLFANARLIAAAPELYDALVSIVRGTKPDYDLVKAVLDKIEKEPSDETN